MPVFLTIAGMLLGIAGLFLIGFAIPIRDFSLGSTLIIAGATSLVGGVIVLGLGATVREVRKLAKVLEKPRQPEQTARPATSVAAARPAAAAPARPLPRPGPGPAARGPRAEPRLDIPASQPPGMAAPPAASQTIVPPPSAPTAGEFAAERPSRGLFASIRGRAAVEAAVNIPPEPTTAPIEDGGDTEPAPLGGAPEPFVEAPPATHSPSLSALAARTAARLDLPRPVPDLPRAAPERQEPALHERPAAEHPSEKPVRNMFDTVWPSDSRPAEHGAERRDDVAAPGPRQQEILKSGVIDGMAYTLYTDGSIEAQLPQGTLRFGSIDDLRAHLERTD